ncbi:MAG: hypothetical protein ACRD15_08740 [Vicinamibacterales bacterium]
MFRTQLGALVNPIDLASTASLATFHRDNWTTWSLYRRFLELDLLALVAGLLVLNRLRRRYPDRVSLSALAGLMAVAALVLLFMVGPWRIVFASKFRQATHNNNQCYVLGADGTDVLLHCPTTSPPRNRVVRRDDPRLEMTEVIGDLFSAHKVP